MAEMKRNGVENGNGQVWRKPAPIEGVRAGPPNERKRQFTNAEVAPTSSPVLRVAAPKQTTARVVSAEETESAVTSITLERPNKRLFDGTSTGEDEMVELSSDEGDNWEENELEQPPSKIRAVGQTVNETMCSTPEGAPPPELKPDAPIKDKTSKRKLQTK